MSWAINAQRVGGQDYKKTLTEQETQKNGKIFWVGRTESSRGIIGGELGAKFLETQLAQTCSRELPSKPSPTEEEREKEVSSLWGFYQGKKAKRDSGAS